VDIKLSFSALSLHHSLKTEMFSALATLVTQAPYAQQRAAHFHKEKDAFACRHN
jgi:hypothetical protein